MASITSVISLFVLLATYCYSVPIESPKVISKPIHESTTGKTIIDHENKINMQLMPEDESTVVPNIHHERTLDGHNTVESTTPVEIKHVHGVSDKRGIDEHLLETTTEFENRAIRSDVLVPEVESTTLRKRDFPEGEIESDMTTLESKKRGMMPEMQSDMVTTPETKKRDMLLTEIEITYTPESKKRGMMPEVDSKMVTTPETKKRDMLLTEIEITYTPESKKRGMMPEVDSKMVTTPESKKRSMMPEMESDMVTTLESERRGMMPEMESEVATDEPSSSVDSFGKLTGLLPGDHLNEETKKERLPNAVPMIPVKGESQPISN